MSDNEVILIGFALASVFPYFMTLVLGAFFSNKKLTHHTTVVIKKKFPNYFKRLSILKSIDWLIFRDNVLKSVALYEADFYNQAGNKKRAMVFVDAEMHTSLVSDEQLACVAKSGRTAILISADSVKTVERLYQRIKTLMLIWMVIMLSLLAFLWFIIQ